MTKQELVDKISETAQLGKRYKLARGSSVPSDLFIDLQNKFRTPRAQGMENRAAAFCDFYNVEWDENCDSSSSSSGGGGTVTKFGLEQLLKAVIFATAIEN
jgi:hypothetical protein